MRKLLIILLVLTGHTAISQDIPLGTWRTHASYTEIQFLAGTPEGVFASSRNGLFFFDRSDRSVTRLSKIDGLSGGQYTALAYDAERQTLVIGYENGLIDFFTAGGEVITINDFADSRVRGSSAINHIEVSASTYYLAVSIGVLVIDADSRQIQATFRNLGARGEEVPITSTAVFNDSLFLAAGSELLSVALDENVNQQDFSAYVRYPWPYQSLLSYVEASGGFMLAASPSQLVSYQEGGVFSEVDDSPGMVLGLSAYPNGILVAGSSEVYTFGPSLEPLSTISADNLIAVSGEPDESLYISDLETGLSVYEGGVTESFRPNGILHPIPGKLYSRGQKLFALYTDPYLVGRGLNGFSVFDNGLWKNYAANIPSANSIPVEDIYHAITFRPEDNRYYLGTENSGLLLWDAEDEFALIDENTTGGPFADQVPVISGLHTTTEGDVLMVAYNQPQPLYRLDTEDSWSQIALSGSLRNTVVDVTSTFFGDYFLLARPLSGSGGIIAVRDQEQISQVNLTQNTNDLPGRIQFDLTEDLDGRLYIGGLAGVAFLPFPSIVFEEPVNAQRPVFDQRFLLENETVTSIAIDGGDRKWLGTYNGAWLFDDSGENIEQIYQFTTDNSPLPSDTLYDISINSITGEVFFATAGGLVSYREGATGSTRFFGEVKVFPNPVPSDFSGQVGISGLATDASVKITNMKGKLIRELEADGGTATWDLRDYNGKRMGPGIYIFFSSDRNGTESFAGKLAILP